jgi:hypothetical protein
LRKLLFILFACIVNIQAEAQLHIATYAINAVDSVAKSNGPGSCFAQLYVKTTIEIEKQLIGLDTSSINQIRKLEKNFCFYFINACKGVGESNDTVSTWYSYFKNNNSTELKRKLFGINAHINGDLWQALRDSYNKEEIVKAGRTVFQFHQSLLKIYNDLYEEAKTANKKVKTIHVLSLGFAKSYGRHLLKKWRKRQIKIATLYYYDQQKFEQIKIKTEKKKNKIDKTINRQLKD